MTIWSDAESVRSRPSVSVRGRRRTCAGTCPAHGGSGVFARECMISAEFLEDFGFEVVAPHHRFPRLRLELDRDHGWKADVEEALERLLKRRR